MKGKTAAPNEMLVPIIGPMYDPGNLRLGVYKRGQPVELPLDDENSTTSVRELCKRLMDEGGVNLNLLVHSGGGLTDAMKYYQYLIDTVKAHSGVVRAYVPVYAGSAAAVLYSMADEHNLADTATVMFHGQATPQITALRDVSLLMRDGTLLPAQICKRTDVPFEEERENDRNRVRDFLLKDLRRDLHDQVQAALQRAFDDPKNIRDEITLKAGELAALGKARTFRKQRDLRIQFVQDTSIHIPTNPELRAVWAQAEDPSYL